MRIFFPPTSYFLFFLACLFFPACDDSSSVDLSAGLVSVFSGRGRQPGSLIKPRGIAISPDQNIYVVDITGRIQAFSPLGAYLFGFRTPKIEKGKPTGMGFSAQGNLYVADTHYHRILCYSPRGRLLFQFGKYGTRPEQFVYVTDVAISRKGYIYVAQYGDALGKYDRIQKFDKSGHFICAWGKRGRQPGEFDRPMSLAFEASGNLLVADACNHRIQRFSENGEFLATWGHPGVGQGYLSYPYGIAVDTKGNIWVSEFGNNRIQKFSPTGVSEGCFGIAGRQKGMFANPWDIAISKSNEIYVVDALNHRIQKISPQLFE